MPSPASASGRVSDGDPESSGKPATVEPSACHAQTRACEAENPLVTTSPPRLAARAMPASEALRGVLGSLVGGRRR